VRVCDRGGDDDSRTVYAETKRMQCRHQPAHRALKPRSHHIRYDMGYLRHYDSQLNLTQGAEEQKSDKIK